MYPLFACFIFFVPSSFAHHLHYFKLNPSKHQLIALMPAPKVTITATPIISFSSSNQAVNLGMNGLPVSNQGMYGSCVTFAMTAILNALLDSKEWISESCILTLGQYLEKYGYQHSGWRGLMPDILFARLKEYGVIHKTDEQKCLATYPLDSVDIPTKVLSPKQYHLLSYQLNPKFRFKSILSYQEFLNHRYSAEQILDNTRTALNEGKRVLIGVLIPALNYAGAEGGFKVSHDTWILTTPILNKLKDLYHNPLYFGGHQMIVTGYNDNAYVIDSEGNIHQGLFTLRNSWGDAAGYHGDFYMSYAYLTQLSVDLKSIQLID